MSRKKPRFLGGPYRKRVEQAPGRGAAESRKAIVVPAGKNARAAAVFISFLGEELSVFDPDRPELGEFILNLGTAAWNIAVLPGAPAQSLYKEVATAGQASGDPLFMERVDALIARKQRHFADYPYRINSPHLVRKKGMWQLQIELESN